MSGLSPTEMALELGKLAYSKREWLNTFSSGQKRRPEHEIETRRRELEVLEQATDDYQRVATQKIASPEKSNAL